MNIGSVHLINDHSTINLSVMGIFLAVRNHNLNLEYK